MDQVSNETEFSPNHRPEKRGLFKLSELVFLSIGALTGHFLLKPSPVAFGTALIGSGSPQRLPSLSPGEGDCPGYRLLLSCSQVTGACLRRRGLAKHFLEMKCPQKNSPTPEKPKKF